MTNLRDIIYHCRGVIGNHPFLIDKFLKVSKPVEPDNPTDDEKAAAKISTKYAYMTKSFLSGLNQVRYSESLNDLHNTFRIGRDEYPKTLTAPYDLAIKWKGDVKGPRMTPNYGLDFSIES